MSTEINLEELYNKSVKILTDLIGFRTISGDDNSALINYCEDYLHKLGATSFKTFDKEEKRVNLFATLKAKKTNGIKPIILSVKSARNPFMTDITIIKIATPNIMPKKENKDIIFRNPCFLFGLKFLTAISLSV